MINFSTIHLIGVDRSGLNFELHGLCNDLPFHIEMNITPDKRWVDTKCLGSSTFDPTYNTEFANVLYENEKFKRLWQEGINLFKLLQTIEL